MDKKTEKTYTIRLTDGDVLNCREGENLYGVLAAAGKIDAPCGGRGICGKCRVTVNGEEKLACLTRVASDLEIAVPDTAAASPIQTSGAGREIDIDPALPGDLGIAFDLGTTTIAAALVDLKSGATLGTSSRMNSQSRFGQDVISRIRESVSSPEGAARLRDAAAGDLTALTLDLLQREKAEPDRVKRAVICGNTTMIHLLLGADCSGLAKAPYRPAFEGPMECGPDRLSLPLAGGCRILMLPAVSAFVGGDITAGILACGLKKTEVPVLFIDIGTNSEIVLADRGRLVSCSCAAGPALEGMNISCGTRAKNGAVEDVKTRGGQVLIRTIGDGLADGICGSGILAAVTALLACGAMDRSGRLLDKPAGTPLAIHFPFIGEEEAGRYFRITPQIHLTQKDIRQIQLAKGAILSGIRALLRAVGKEAEDIPRVIVSGQFGSHLAPEDLTGAGLLPKEWLGRIFYAGNTSMSGAKIALLSQREADACPDLIRDMEYIELSRTPGYSDLYIDSLNF